MIIGSCHVTVFFSEWVAPCPPGLSFSRQVLLFFWVLWWSGVYLCHLNASVLVFVMGVGLGVVQARLLADAVLCCCVVVMPVPWLGQVLQLPPIVGLLLLAAEPLEWVCPGG